MLTDAEFAVLDRRAASEDVPLATLAHRIVAAAVRDRGRA